MIDLSTRGQLNHGPRSHKDRSPAMIDPADARPNGGTRLMREYQSLKQHSRGALLMFRFGVYYAFFFEDAEKTAKALKIQLTRRGAETGSGIPQCLVPLYAAEAAVMVLTQKGYKVAMCDQAEIPSEGNGLAPRKAA